jgi:hypothetical protein
MALQTVRSTGSHWRCNILSYPPVIAALLKHVDNLRPIPCYKKEYYPRYTKGRGVGLFAARSFDVGETIIIERPSVITVRVFLGDPRIVERLWEGFAGDELLNLSLLFNRHKEDAEKGQPWAYGVQRTNGFGFSLPTPKFTPKEACALVQDDCNVPEDTGWRHTMIFLDTSRLNHS